MSKGKTSDWLVAGSVIVCSIILLAALTLGLAGRTHVPDSREVFVRFDDITGLRVSSQVKYAGANAGAVSRIRMLNAAERAESPGGLVEITLRLAGSVPPLTEGTEISIASDTLLADKFVLVKAGPTEAPPLAADARIKGVTPTSFDQLVRNADEAIVGLRRILAGNATDGARDVLTRAADLIERTEGVVVSLEPVVTEARGTFTELKETASGVNRLLADNRERLGTTLTRIDTAVTRVSDLAARADSLVKSVEKPLTATLADFRVTAENLRATSAYTRFLFRFVAERPSRLIWGARPGNLPSETEPR